MSHLLFEKSPSDHFQLATLFDYEFSWWIGDSYPCSILDFNLDAPYPFLWDTVCRDALFSHLLEEILTLNINKIIEQIEERYQLLFPPSYKLQYQRIDRIKKEKVKQYQK